MRFATPISVAVLQVLAYAREIHAGGDTMALQRRARGLCPKASAAAGY